MTLMEDGCNLISRSEHDCYEDTHIHILDPQCQTWGTHVGGVKGAMIGHNKWTKYCDLVLNHLDIRVDLCLWTGTGLIGLPVGFKTLAG